MPYKKNEYLQSLIEGKKIAMVGPAQYLVDKGLGNIINNYDIVCRVNYMAADKYEIDYGNRTDIMFYNCATSSLKQMEQHFKQYPKYAKGLKLVVCPIAKAAGPDKWREWPSDYISPVVENFHSINVYNNEFYWIGMDNYRYFFNLIACSEPNTGMVTLAMLLEYTPKEILFIGFTFYEDKGTYFPRYATKAPGFKGITGHNQGAQKEFFKTKALSYDNIKIDSYLNRLLNLNHNNILKL